MTVPTFPRLDDLLTRRPPGDRPEAPPLEGLQAFAAALEGQCAAVLHLHTPVESDDGSRRLDCAECGFWYPCPTARILLPDYTEPAAVGG